MTKTISLTNEVYSKLKKLKKLKGGKSFSEEINDLLEKAEPKGDIKSLKKFMGVLSKPEAKAFQREISIARSKAKPRVF